MQSTACLHVTDSFGIRRTVPLLKPVFTIGRKVESDLHIMSTTVSRDHGEIVCENGTYYLVDKGSKSGVFINGQRVERTALSNLDRITLGGADEYQIQFIVNDQSDQLSSTDGLASGEMNLAATAKEKLKNLARYVEINQAFKFSLAPDDVLTLVVDAAIELAGAERGLIMLKGDGEGLAFKVARDNRRNNVEQRDFALSTRVVREVLAENRTVILNTTPANDQQMQSVYNLSLQTVICIPLHQFQMQATVGVTSMLQRKLLGILYLDSRRQTGHLSQTNSRLLDSLAFEASKALENARLLHEEQEKQRLEREFEMAQSVQVALLPTSDSTPQSKYFELAAQSLPCRYVGGDFYDLMALQNGTVLTLCDVSGKGISAALLASVAQGVIEAQFYAGASPAEVATTLNRVVVNRSDANRFITMFCSVLGVDGNFSWVNAGHNPSILARQTGEIEMLSTNSLVLGAFDFAEYCVTNTRLLPGDVVFIFSDGVTEATNGSEQMFGDQRLQDLVLRNKDRSAQEIKDLVMSEVLAFTSGEPQGDDITVVVLKMK
jgi:sigma-B regulation protein RsbU (phosphoserine phosphatase)